MKEYQFMFYRDEILLERQPAGKFTIPFAEEAPFAPSSGDNVIDITAIDGSKAKAYRLAAPITNEEGYEMCGLRKSFYKLPSHLYKTAGKCKELLYWDVNTKYCGACGSPLKMNTPISKKCGKCGKEVWPQLSPAIIVLIHRDNDVLLVHAKNFKGSFFGLVAGFVETGETFEEAVHREVLEETGLKIKNLKYFGSQPWPYPCGIMVGFNADYESGTLRLQKSELSAGSWFNKEDLPEMPEKLSIARRLIDAWLERHDG